MELIVPLVGSPSASTFNPLPVTLNFTPLGATIVTLVELWLYARISPNHFSSNVP